MSEVERGVEDFPAEERMLANVHEIQRRVCGKFLLRPCHLPGIRAALTELEAYLKQAIADRDRQLDDPDADFLDPFAEAADNDK